MSNDKYTWDLASLYNDEELIFSDINKCNELAHDFVTNYQALEFNKKHLKNSLDEYFSITRLLDKCYVYVNHQLDIDTTNQESIKLHANVVSKVYEIYALLSFYMPKLASDENLLTDALKDPQFMTYKQVLTDIRNNGKYMLDDKLEKVLAEANETLSQSAKIYEVLTNADMKFVDIEDSSGVTHPMSHGMYTSHMMSKDRKLRENAFTQMLTNYANLNFTLSATYSGEIEKDIFLTKSRGYKSTRERALKNNNIDEVIYDNLLAVTNENISINHQYVKLRKKLLGLSELHLYDMYVPLTDDVKSTYSYEDAKTIIMEALKPLGDEYITILQKAFDERWIDVYERAGKKSGAYSGGCYDSKPFIFMSYANTLNDVYTLVHELGHSIHTYLANNKQQYHNSRYVIFVAEIASTVNELLLTNYLLSQATSEKKRANILNYKLEQYRTTVLRQTMFAEFEYYTKNKVEVETKLTGSDYNQIYYDLNKKYFGSSICVDELIKYEWSRIPHFYYNYYVYQYATSFCYAVYITEKMKNDENMATKYIDFLSIGGSQDALSSLQTVGIDALSKAPYEAAFGDFKATLELFEESVKMER